MESLDGDSTPIAFSLKQMEFALELDSGMVRSLKQDLDNPTSAVEYHEFIRTLHDLLVVNGHFVSGNPIATVLNSFHDDLLLIDDEEDD